MRHLKMLTVHSRLYFGLKVLLIMLVLALMPVSKPKASLIEDVQNNMPAAQAHRELRCLAKAIYHESRGESVTGQMAVGQVVLNRVNHDDYPDSICGVVYQKTHVSGKTTCQFSWTCKRSIKAINESNALWTRALEVAYTVMYSNAPSKVGKAVNFHAVHASPPWARYKQRVATIGNHVFYK